MNPPSVHVLVINWNGREHLRDCFASLCASPYENARFILVDNGSEDDSIDFVTTEFGYDARVSILSCPENIGWSGGNNVGMRQAQDGGADFILLLNNDTWVAPDCIERLVQAMEERPDCGAMAPRMVLFDQPDVLNSIGLEMSRIGAAWDRGIGRADSADWHRPTEVIGVCGGACFLRTSVLDETGLLPEDFEIYLDDLDLCLRLWDAGYSIWTCPEAVVRHKFSATMGAGSRARHKYYLNTRNRFRVLLRNFSAIHLLQSVPYVVLGELKALGRAVQEGAWWRMVAHVRAWLSAVAYVPAAWSGGARACRFWHLVRRRPLFCPKIVLPEEGWYGPVEIEGSTWCPMASRARLPVPEGSLRVLLANCYPEGGPVQVDLTLNERPIGSLRASHREEAVFDVTEGMLQLHAPILFSTIVNGGVLDVGGWLQIWCGDNRLV